MQKGFTPAEVLITLGIIGIVAAMTLPAVMTNYRKKEIPVRLEKFTSTMQNAFNLATVDYGEASTWTFPTGQMDYEQINTFVHTYLYPYLTGIKECSSKEGICKQINTNLYGDSTFYGKPIYIFEDGSCFSVLTGGASSEGSNLHFLYDYNCLGKPNKKDEDIFAFYMRYNNGKSTVFSAGGAATWNLKTREQLLDVCKNHDKDGHSPGSCSALIQYDGWEIKDDYPWIR